MKIKEFDCIILKSDGKRYTVLDDTLGYKGFYLIDICEPNPDADDFEFRTVSSLDIERVVPYGESS